MDYIEFTKKFAEILNQKNLSKIEFKTKDLELCIESAKVTSVTAAPVATAPVAVNPPVVEAPKKTGNYITSPIIGTFYSRPAPEKPPFVNIGDKVKKGQVVCIVESMKLMNEITSEFDGTVAAVLALDGEAVDFGKELIEIV